MKLIDKTCRNCLHRNVCRFYEPNEPDCICNHYVGKDVLKPKWIPVTPETMPDENDGDYVLVCATCKVTNKIEYRNAVVMAFVCEEGFVDTELDEVLTGVTHWMPLPDAPEVTG